MLSQDRNKIKKAGFRIFRQRLVHPISGGVVKNEIWELSDKGSWCKFAGDYPSKAAMARVWVELMKDSKNIGEGETEEHWLSDTIWHGNYHSIIGKLRGALSALVGASDSGELKAMLAAVQAAPFADEDKAALINAITVLLEMGKDIKS
jgi:hypothetical protein